ncbi:hypothetical protein GOQ29_12180 [Clostridium sp. D2Q-14]|uniref:hypothetical protein n=1 Tax=Anaeromonas gelatinilytica TaxID=2683194 RepID=UPI00193BBD4B|nr:hypothetical protein [Anaeromonas gelatinilytica]MBS4536375.1 hypothetical protein [Anaeromonas gelatinilytica]
MKKVIGIISMVLFLFITLQSCVAGVGNAIEGQGEMSGSAGLFLAIFMLVSGILLMISKDKKGILITSIVFYIIGGLIGIFNVGSYSDLAVWSVLSFIFGGLLILHLFRNKDIYNKKNESKSDA